MTPRWRDDDDMAFVSFFLGPVQSFIEAARSVRDLWTGVESEDTHETPPLPKSH